MTLSSEQFRVAGTITLLAIATGCATNSIT
jgi:hypothetical protein